MSVLPVNAIDFRKESKYVYGKYGIQSYPHRKDYNIYLGKVFTYLPANPMLHEEEWQDFAGKRELKYQIVNITTTDEGKPDMDIIVHYYRATDDAGYRAHNRPKRNRIFNYDKTTSVFQVPFVFISNNSPNTIKILWDEAVFVNVDGLTSKIIHSGIKFIDKEQSQVPSSIIRGATLVDEIIPSGNISFKEDRLLDKREWVAAPLFDNLTPISQPLNMRVMLPIQIKDVVNEYILEFEVDYVYSFPYTIRKKK